jgi:hypothetical protein
VASWNSFNGLLFAFALGFTFVSTSFSPFRGASFMVALLSFSCWALLSSIQVSISRGQTVYETG